MVPWASTNLKAWYRRAPEASLEPVLELVESCRWSRSVVESLVLGSRRLLRRKDGMAWRCGSGTEKGFSDRWCHL